jgi:hypothetical protein
MVWRAWSGSQSLIQVQSVFSSLLFCYFVSGIGMTDHTHARIVA